MDIGEDGDVTLADKYVRRDGRIYISGVQALVRLPLLQRERDAARGFNTAGFISGYRGSPLGTYDMTLTAAGDLLAAAAIRFQPGLNEELAATSVWGTQQLAFQPKATVDGVFAIWYAKGPGVDRSMDVLKHANSAGTAPLGGALAVFGDDHGAQSSVLLHQSEPMFAAAYIPVLNPASIAEEIEFGLYGFELSRFAGCWVGLKATTEIVESSATISAVPPPLPVRPADFILPRGGLGIRRSDSAPDQERRLVGPRMEAVAAFVRANPVDRLLAPKRPARLGIATTGKAHADVLQALQDLGIGDSEAAALGIRIYKIGLSWPLEPLGVRNFAEGLDEVLVVEEKRAFVEPQLLAVVQTMPLAPRVTGKSDTQGQPLLPSHGELSPVIVARGILARLAALGIDVSRYTAAQRALEVLVARDLPPPPEVRAAFFCSGCPHNSSTKVPDGSRAMAGTGCHSMAMSIPSRHTETIAQMGGEGANWIGQSPFTREEHVFVNLGDGTYSHSGLLAIRAAAAAGVNATYKILVNDAVAMTGGQPTDAHLSVAQIAHQVTAEGAARVVVLAEDVGRYARGDFPARTELLDRSALERIQRELRMQRGLSVIIYDQVCAAEKRRRRKRDAYPEAPKRVFVNDAVCEACGDCSAQSNCISVVSQDTPLGPKRLIDQSSCNGDYSCVKGFCPSFVTIEGARPRVRKMEFGHLEEALAALPDPATSALDAPYNILVTGIGGTGVITIGALLGMAAHLEGKAASVLDYTGLAQKNGAVTSQVRLAPEPGMLPATRVGVGAADVLLACDVVVGAGAAQLSRLKGGRGRAVVNTHVQPPAALVLDPSRTIDGGAMIRTIERLLGAEQVLRIDATEIATRLIGDSIYANIFLLGLAWQRGLIPLALGSLMRAVELNGAGVVRSRRAFALGRLAAVDPQRLVTEAEPAPMTADAVIADRRRRLVDYQGERYAARFDALVDAVEAAERRAGFADRLLAVAAARNFHRLMAYKDEYEVARLYSGGDFAREVVERFDGIGRIEVHLSPPLLARRDPVTGIPRKIAFGPWILRAFGLLAALRGLRGTPFDIFGYTAERRVERRLISDYEQALRGALANLTAGNRAQFLELAEIPDAIRGFGHIKDRNVALAMPRFAALAAELTGGSRATGPSETAAMKEIA